MEGNKQIDLGGFTLYDSTPISADRNEIEQQITDRTINNIYYIFEEAKNAKKQEITNIESLPEEEQIHDFDQHKLYFRLPECSILFPRSKRLPEKKILTKW